MADDVSVVFGASIDKLIAGVEQAKGAIESVKDSTDKVSEGAKSLLEGLLAAFSVEGISAFIEKMATLGTQTERTMALLGVSSETVGELNFVAQATGGSLDSLATTTERMALNVQKSTKDAFNPAALALQKLGLSVADFEGLSADEYINKVADASAKFANDFDKAQVLMALGGRGMAQLIPILAQGSEGLDELRQKALDAGGTLDEKTTKSLADVHVALLAAQAAVTGLGAVVVSALSPAIIDSAEKFAEFTSEVKNLVAGGQLLSAIFETFRGLAAEIATRLAVLGTLVKDVFTLNWSAIRADYDAGMAQIDAVIADHAKRQQEILGNAIGGGSPAGLPSQAGEGEKPGIGQLPFPNKDTTSAALKEMNAEIAIVQQGLQQEKLLITGAANQWRITTNEKFASMIAATEDAYQQERAIVQRALDTTKNLTLTQRTELNEKLRLLDAKHNTDLLQLDMQAVAAQQQIWQQGLDMVTSSFNSNLAGLIKGTTTWADALKATWDSLLVKFIEVIESMVVKWAAAELARTTATTSGAAARAGAEETSILSTMAVSFANTVKSIVASAAQTFAGVFAFLSPMMGPAAAGPAAVSEGVVAATAAAVPALDVGTDRVVKGGLAFIHQDEAVIPAETSGPWSGGGMQAAPNVTVNFSAMGRLMSSEIKDHARTIAPAVAEVFSLNPRLRPRY